MRLTWTLPYFIICTLLLSCGTSAFAAQTKQFSLDGFAVVEDVSNFSGGIKNGSVLNAIWHGVVNYNFLNSHDSSVRFGILAITYTKNQQLYTGSRQSVSNLSAQREIRIGELNYYQNLNDWATYAVAVVAKLYCIEDEIKKQSKLCSNKITCVCLDAYGLLLQHCRNISTPQ